MKYVNHPTMSDYLTATDSIYAAHKTNPPLTMPLVHALDALFSQEIFVGERDIGPVVHLLASNAVELLFNAIKQALSGHTSAIFPVLKPALESACCAYLISKDNSLAAIWVNRHVNKAASKASRDAFGRAVHCAAEKLDSDLQGTGSLLKELYQTLIDKGGHPNPEGILPYISTPEWGDDLILKTEALHQANSRQINWAILNCCAVGIRIAFIISLVLRVEPLLRDGCARLDALVNLADEYGSRMG